MADEITQANQETGGPAEKEQPKTIDDETKAAIIETVKAELEGQYKSEMAGVNRKNTELTKELDEVKKAQMNEKDRLKYEFDQRSEKLTERETAVSATEKDLAKAQAIAATGLPDSFKSRLVGDTPEALLLDAQKLKALFDGEIQEKSEKRTNETLVTTGKTLETGKAPTTMSAEAYTQMGDKERLQFIKDHPQDYIKIADEILKSGANVRAS